MRPSSSMVPLGVLRAGRLPPSPSSSLSSAGLRSALAAATAGFTQTGVVPLGRRGMRAPSMAKMKREMEKPIPGLKSKEQSVAKATQAANNEYFARGAMPLLPGTFVATPLSQYPRSPKDMWRYQFQRSKAWFTGALAAIYAAFQSMDGWKSRLKIRRGQIPPTAKAMYTEMLEAFAAGDKRTLRRLCTANFAEKLESAVDRRATSGQSLHFEITGWKSPLFYPSLRSHLISKFNPYDQVTYTEQAVVAIASTQTLRRYKTSTREPVGGSKVQDKIEYVVLLRQTNSETYARTPWRIWGTTSATTLEKFDLDQLAMEKEQRKRAGWTT